MASDVTTIRIRERMEQARRGENEYLSAGEYNQYLLNGINRAQNEVVRNFIDTTFNEWLGLYMKHLTFLNVRRMLDGLKGTDFRVYIDSADELALLSPILSSTGFANMASFRGFILNDSLLDIVSPGAFSPFPVTKRSSPAIEAGTSILAFSSPGTPTEFPCITSNHMEDFIPLSRFAEALSIRKQFADQRIILYADYRKSQGTSAISGYIKRCHPEFKVVGLFNEHVYGSDSFDSILGEPFLYLWPLVFIALQPDIVHLNVGVNTQGTPFTPFVPNPDKTVIDFYDVLALMPDSALSDHWEELSVTRACDDHLFSEFNYFVHKCADHVTTDLRRKYNKDNIFSVTEYVKDPVYHQKTEGGNIIKLAYGGLIVIDSNIQDAHYETFMLMVDFFCRNNMHLYIYPSPYLYGNGRNLAIDELISRHNIKNINNCMPLAEDDFVREISSYDFGVIPPTPEKGRPSAGGYILSFKFIAYLRAGLPVLVPEDLTFISDIVRKHGLGIAYRYEDRDRLPEIINAQDINRLKERVVRFRDKMHINIGGEKVFRLYKMVLEQNISKSKGQEAQLSVSNGHNPLCSERLATESSNTTIQPTPTRSDSQGNRTPSNSGESFESTGFRIPKTGFLSFEEYNRYLTECLQQAGPDLDREYVVKELNGWMASYLDYQILVRACALLQSIRGKNYVIYIENPKGLEFFHKLSRVFRLDQSSGFLGLLVDDKIFAAVQHQVFLGYPSIPVSQFGAKFEDVTVFSPFCEVPPHSFPKLCINDYMTNSIDISKFENLRNLLSGEDGRCSILYPFYREIHTAGILAGHLRKSLPHTFQSIALVGNVDLIENEYDHVIKEPFFYLWPLIFRLVNPDVYHVNVGWGIQALPFLPFVPDKRKTLIDFYEILSFLPDRYFDLLHSTSKQVKSAEEYIFKHYENIMHFCSEETTSRLLAKYKTNNSIVSVTEYLEEPTYCEESPDKDLIKLVYGGNMVIKNSPDDMLYKPFLKVVKYFSRDNLYLYIFNSPYIHGFNVGSGLDDLIKEHNLTHVVSCQPLKRVDFIKHISKLDYGAFLIRPADMKAPEYNYFMAYKFLSYLMAGLPVVIDAGFKYMADLIKQYSIGVVLENDDDYERLPQILNSQDLTALKNNVLEHRHRFNIRNAISKVARIYHGMASARRDERPYQENQRKAGPVDYCEKNPEKTGELHKELASLINHIARDEKRLYYRDQTPLTLLFLIDLVQSHIPTKVIELGTLSGLSLRSWLLANKEIKVTAIDLSFQSLKQTQALFPFDSSRVTLLEQDILKTDFSSLWSSNDRVFFYLDAHDAPGIEIMDHVLKNAIPHLPQDSLFIVDDLWFSPLRLTNENAAAFLHDCVLNEIDPLQCFDGYFAPYWEGGSFMGFAEVVPLMRWVNENRIKLTFAPGVKNALVKLADQAQSFRKESNLGHEDSRETGVVHYSPVADAAFCAESSPQSDQALTCFAEGSKAFEQGDMIAAYEYFNLAQKLLPSLGSVSYARSVCMVRLGQLDPATQLLRLELQASRPHPNTQRLLHDIQAWQAKQSTPESREITGNEKCPAEVTFFAMPKAFEGHIATIQHNAIKSWTLLDPRPEIILFGDEKGTAEIARELGLRHVSDVKYNEHGTPMVDDLFFRGEREATCPVVAYVNADIILTSDFLPAIAQARSRFSSFFMIGRRWDLDVVERIDFSDSGWERNFRDQLNNTGRLHEATGIDYFIYTRGLWQSIPPFAIGRTSWDNWFVFQALKQGSPVIDATQAIFAIHQNHDYQHVRGGEHEAWNGAEAKGNLALLGGYENVRTVEHATWKFTKTGIEESTSLRAEVLAKTPKIDAHGLERAALSEPARENLRFMQLDLFYPKVMEALYASTPDLNRGSFAQQTEAIFRNAFAAVHSVAPYLGSLGYDVQWVVANCGPAQSRWASENGYKLVDEHTWVQEIARAQIESFRPDVLYTTDAMAFDSRFIRSLRHRPRLVLGWQASDIPAQTDWSEFDLILSTLEGIRRAALDLGAKSAEYFIPGFPEWIYESVKHIEPIHDVTFCGQWTLGQHRKRNEYLKRVAQETQNSRQFTCGFHLSGQLEAIPAQVARYNLGERYGIGMYQSIREGRIGLDARGDIRLLDRGENGSGRDMAGRETANMRVFETTGCGVFLLTEHLDNLARLFEIGKEIETFRSEAELIDKIRYYLSHPNERQEIAERGHKRCMREHSMGKRIHDLDRIIRRHVDLKQEMSSREALHLVSGRNSMGETAHRAAMEEGHQTAHNTQTPNLGRVQSVDCSTGLSPALEIAKMQRFGNWRVHLNNLTVSCHDLLSFYMAAKDIFTQGIYDFESARPNPFIIDGGGHIGLFTLRAKQRYPQARIKIFEPDKLSLELLRKNIADNQLTDIEVVEAGLYSQDCSLGFGSDKSDGSSLFSGHQDSTINVVRLSRFIDEPVDFLKLNIEGAESDVLAEVEPKLDLVKEMVIEYHGFPEIGQKLHDILAILDAHGFRYMIHDFDAETNAASKPPFRLSTDSRFFLLIYAKKLLPSKPSRGTSDGEPLRTIPISKLFGFDRGMPIDRYYIEKFLAANSRLIRGEVLEIGDSSYTRRFGTAVTKSDVLSAVPTPDATIVGDLASGKNIPKEAFDCIILTQTLQMIFDLQSALRNAFNSLKPGGTLLLTTSGISQISRYDMDRWGEYWRLTDKSMRKLLSELAPEESINVETFGNVAVAKAFLDGLATHELPESVLEYRDEDYQVVLCGRVVKNVPEKAIERQGRQKAVTAPQILIYHRVAEDPIDSQLLAVSPNNFEEHLKALASSFCVIPLREFIDKALKGALEPETVAITFDDGYRDNLTNALPILEKYRMHATIFVTAGMVGESSEFWWDALEKLFLTGRKIPSALNISINSEKMEWRLSTPADRLRAYDELSARMRALPPEHIRQIVEGLLAWAQVTNLARPTHKILNREELRQLAASPFIEIGSHTVTHARLALLPPEIQREELRNSRLHLEAISGQPVHLVSYPFGSQIDFSSKTFEIAAEEGYVAGISNIQADVKPPIHPFALPRRLVRNWSGPDFVRWLTSIDKDQFESLCVAERNRRLSTIIPT